MYTYVWCIAIYGFAPLRLRMVADTEGAHPWPRHVQQSMGYGIALEVHALFVHATWNWTYSLIRVTKKQTHTHIYICDVCIKYVRFTENFTFQRYSENMSETKKKIITGNGIPSVHTFIHNQTKVFVLPSISSTGDSQIIMIFLRTRRQCESFFMVWILQILYYKKVADTIFNSW